MPLSAGIRSQVTVQSYALVKQSIAFQHYWHYESWISNNTVIALGARHCNWPHMCSLEKRATFWQKQSVPRCLIQSHKVWEDPGSHHLFLLRISAEKKSKQKKLDITEVIFLLLHSSFTSSWKRPLQADIKLWANIRIAHSFIQQDCLPSTQLHNFTQNNFTSVKLGGI